MIKMTIQDKLIRLYQEMHELTEPECRLTCRCPRSCCSPEYCLDTIRYAQESWGVTLAPTDHAKLPLMGPAGCIAAPHLRPCCTMHTCDVNGIGFKRGDREWTERYFAIRKRIDTLEWRRTPIPGDTDHAESGP